MSAKEPDIVGVGIEASPIVASRLRIARSSIQRLPVMLHQVDGILMSQRHKVQIFLLSQLIPLVKDIIACLTIPVEILSDDVGISLTESTDNSLF